MGEIVQETWDDAASSAGRSRDDRLASRIVLGDSERVGKEISVALEITNENGKKDKERKEMQNTTEETIFHPFSAKSYHSITQQTYTQIVITALSCSVHITSFAGKIQTALKNSFCLQSDLNALLHCFPDIC